MSIEYNYMYFISEFHLKSLIHNLHENTILLQIHPHLCIIMHHFISPTLFIIPEAAPIFPENSGLPE